MAEQDADRLRRLQKYRVQPAPTAGALGPEVLAFFRREVDKRCRRLCNIAQRWAQLVPAPLAEHTALESFHAGVLTVLVDSAAHLYDLRQLLLAGLEKQLLLACASAGLRRVKLRLGRWYAGEAPGDVRPTFD